MIKELPFEIIKVIDWNGKKHMLTLHHITSILNFGNNHCCIVIDHDSYMFIKESKDNFRNRYLKLIVNTKEF